jgi:uncharacterized protein YkwD
MKKLLTLILTIIFIFLLFGCNNNVKRNMEQKIVELESQLAEKEEPIVSETTTEATTIESTTEKTTAKTYELPSDFLEGYSEPDPVMLDTTAEENGLGESKIFLKGRFTRITEIEYEEDGRMLTSFMGYFDDENDNTWLVNLNISVFSTKDIYTDEIEKKVVIASTYSGFSMKENLPAILLDKMFVFESNKTIKGLGQIMMDLDLSELKLIQATTAQTTSSPTTTAATTTTTTTAAAATTTTATATTATMSVSREERNALETAKNYISIFPFSETGLADQLAFEGFPQNAIDYAIANINADYNEMALKSAKNYLEIFPMSDSELYEQLIFEGYTSGQAQYALDNLD